VKAPLLYRIAGVLIALFAIGHQLGFRRVDPAWHADGVVAAMRNTHFTVQGFDRTYWDLFSGFGFFSTVFLLFSAFLGFELARLPANYREQLASLRWAFALCFVAITVLMLTNFFAAPVVFSALIALCLVLAAMKRGA
jgi:Kef-type K+ transport system membrane component KefB